MVKSILLGNGNTDDLTENFFSFTLCRLQRFPQTVTLDFLRRVGDLHHKWCKCGLCGARPLTRMGKILRPSEQCPAFWGDSLRP